MKLLVELINFWSRASTKYNLLKYDEDKKTNSKKLGVTSIILSIVGAILIVLCSVGFRLLWEHFTGIKIGDNQYDYPFFSLVGLIGLGVLIVGMFVRLNVASLIYLIYQKKLNKQSIGNVALLIWFISLAVMVAGIVIIIFV